MKVSVQNLHAYCVEALTKAGLPEADARTTADALVTTDTWGTFTHGTKALRGYVRRLQGGGLRKNGQPKVVAEGPAWALVVTTIDAAARRSMSFRRGAGYRGSRGT